MDTNQPPTWEELIKSRLQNPEFVSRTCKTYSRQFGKSRGDERTLCSCKRLIRRHSFDDPHYKPEQENAGNPGRNPPEQFLDLTQSTKVPINVFGQLKSTGCKFIRIDNRTKIDNIYDLLLKDCGGDPHKPTLILSVYGGAKYFTMTERLEKEIIRGIVDAASAADTWILTTGVNNGVSKLVGEGIAHYRLLREYPDRVKCIGLTMWGTVNESTRCELKRATNGYPKDLLERQIPDHVQENKETIEENHTHCILFDNSQLNGYLSDRERHELVTYACKHEPCYPVTIIVEGGINTLQVIENDIGKCRPIVIIAGSGRLADVLATLLDRNFTSEGNNQWQPSDGEVRRVIEEFLPNPHTIDFSVVTKQIKEILVKDNRYLLNVFSLNDNNNNNNVAQTIFNAILKDTAVLDANKEDQKQRRRTNEDKLVDLALEWDYLEGVLPILQSRQDDKLKDTQKSTEADKLKDNQESIEADTKREKDLFRRSLETNRPRFVEYFLAASFDPLTILDTEETSQRHTIISKLYEDCQKKMDKNHAKYITTLFDSISNKTTEKLDMKLRKFVGSFIGPIYTCEKDAIRKRVAIDMKNYIGIRPKSTSNVEDVHQCPINKNGYTKDHLLRDLFLWSIFMDMPEMAKVILVHIPSRICAALIASAIFKRYAKLSTTVYLKEKFGNQALEFETYAAKFIDKCYEYNETVACELLLREIPLFGKITCMQVAISSQSGKLLETACFDQTLNQVWYNRLSIKNHKTSSKLFQLLSILSFGLLAPILLKYREEETEIKDRSLSPQGIDYYTSKKISERGLCASYWTRVKYFHQSPLIKMSCHFITYIFFLLTFSYMMLYHLDRRDTIVLPHWTEIYVIITVSTMFCEEIRKLYHEYKTRMTERWGSTGSFLLTLLTNVFYIIPYLMFYLGLGFRYAAYNDSLMTTARIIWAFDLELWYLGSLKFIIALKSIGPKLFMLKNMLQDLFAFIYMIFIAIAAYGVVSRALILYKQVPFTMDAISREILYEPYWFIYGEVSDKDLLDGMISDGTYPGVAEATATHVLLAFHMLFINILILNLLIAVFTHTIDKVQENTEFYWRYQRYSLVRGYFERPPLAYPPLIIVTYIWFLFLALKRKCWPKCYSILRRNKVTDQQHEFKPNTKPNTLTCIFKMIPEYNSQQKAQWDRFENAAIHSYARSILEKNKKKSISTMDDNSSTRTSFTTTSSDRTQVIANEQQTITQLRDEIDALKSVLTTTQKHTEEVLTTTQKHIEEVHATTQKHIEEVLTTTQKHIEENNARMEKQAHDVNRSLDWIMKAITRVKMNDPANKPPFNLDSTLSLESQTTMHPTQ